MSFAWLTVFGFGIFTAFLSTFIFPFFDVLGNELLEDEDLDEEDDIEHSLKMLSNSGSDESS